MPARQEPRRSNDSLKNSRLSVSAAQMERQFTAELNGSIWDEDKVYEPDWEISAAELDTYADMWARD